LCLVLSSLSEITKYKVPSTKLQLHSRFYFALPFGSTSKLPPSSWTREPGRARRNQLRCRVRTGSIAARLRDTSFASKVAWLNRSLRLQPNIASRAYQESRGFHADISQKMAGLFITQPLDLFFLG